VGTLGDVLPFVALGKALQGRGHDVLLAVNSAMHPVVVRAGLTAAPCGPAFGPDEARKMQVASMSVSHSLVERTKSAALLHDVPARYQDVCAACADADLLIAHSFHYAALLTHDQLGVPWVCVSLQPGQFPQHDFPPTAQPAPHADLNLLASSTHFSAVESAFCEHLYITGFWFCDGSDQDDWQPTVAQRDFVEGEDRPLVLCLGCLPGPRAAEVMSIHAQACAVLGKKLVVQTGWADLHDDCLPPDARADEVLLAAFLPHDWLFAHALAVCHHGGLGVTARALKHGCPTLLMPYRKDQLYHAAVVRALGAGGGIDPRKLTVAGLVRMLGERICVEETRQRAQALGASLRAEDGVGTACGLIEDLLQGATGWPSRRDLHVARN
jgi:UDP:flavonoid glycosyltransferase YjiC (YdhE family)